MLRVWSCYVDEQSNNNVTNPVSERILSVRLSAKPVNITFLQVYTPTTSAARVGRKLTISLINSIFQFQRKKMRKIVQNQEMLSHITVLPCSGNEDCTATVISDDLE